MKFNFRAYVPKVTPVFTDSYWNSYTSCDSWFWSDEYFAEPKTVYWGNSYATSVPFPKDETKLTPFKSVTCSSCHNNFASVQDYYKQELHEFYCLNIF